MFSKRAILSVIDLLKVFGLDLDDLDGAELMGMKLWRGNGVLVAWREGETVLYSFSGSAANFDYKETCCFRICSSFGWVSRIDIALDVTILYLS